MNTQDLERRIKALEDNQIKVIMTAQGDANIYRSLFRILTLPSVTSGIGTSNPNLSCILDIQSINKAFRLPCMTTAQRDAISNPAEGMLIYNTTTHALNDYDGSVWGAV